MKAEELFDLGLRHYTKKEYPRALALFEEAAEHGHVPAMLWSGVCYDFALGAPQDYKKAFDLYARAAEAGNAEAQWRLGYFYLYAQGTAYDPASAYLWFERSAKQKDQMGKQLFAQAQEEAEWRYRELLALLPNRDPVALYAAGLCCKYGIGTEKDAEKAKLYLSRAADAGYAPAEPALRE